MTGNVLLHTQSLPFPRNPFPFPPIPIFNFVTYSRSNTIPNPMRLFPAPPIPVSYQHVYYVVNNNKPNPSLVEKRESLGSTLPNAKFKIKMQNREVKMQRKYSVLQ